MIDLGLSRNLAWALQAHARDGAIFAVSAQYPHVWHAALLTFGVTRWGMPGLDVWRSGRAPKRLSQLRRMRVRIHKQHMLIKLRKKHRET
jgi:hypothetical protein